MTQICLNTRPSTAMSITTTMTARMGRPSSLGIARAGLAESNVARSVSDLASTPSPEKLFLSTGRSVRLRRARTTHALIILRTRSYHGLFAKIKRRAQFDLGRYRRARPAERDKSAMTKYLGIEHLRLNNFQTRGRRWARGQAW